MLLREISEPNRSVSFALGRLNPATVGHGLLVEAVKQGPGDAVLFLTDRPAKLPTDPLNPNEKLDWARKSFPDIKIELTKNIMFAASDLYARGYRSVTFFEGENKLGSLLEKYNGQKSAHGFFDFEEIKFERLSRNPDADDASGMSASKMRQAVIDKNFEAFSKGVTKAAQPYAKKMYDNLSTILGSKEEQVGEALPILLGLAWVGRFILWGWKYRKALGGILGLGAGVYGWLKWIEPYKELILGVVTALGIGVALVELLPILAMVFAGGKDLYKKLQNAKTEKEMKEIIDGHDFDKSQFDALMKELENNQKLQAA